MTQCTMSHNSIKHHHQSSPVHPETKKNI